MRKIDPVLHDKLETLISSMGYELVGCEMSSQGRQTVFRIFIDKENGVTVGDCSLVSRQVGAMLDVDDLLTGRYFLEVSSPGIDRPLFELAHFQKQIGHRVKIKLAAAIQQRKQIKGQLLRVDEDNVYVLLDDTNEEICLPFSYIEKANVIGEVKL